MGTNRCNSQSSAWCHVPIAHGMPLGCCLRGSHQRSRWSSSTSSCYAISIRERATICLIVQDRRPYQENAATSLKRRSKSESSVVSTSVYIDNIVDVIICFCAKGP